MQVFARLWIVVFLALPGMISAAESRQVDFAKIEQQLQRYARDLREIGKSMQTHARTTIPKGLNKNQEIILATQRRDLEATADTALNLAKQIENGERKARNGTLTRADMDSLGVPAHALMNRINRKIQRASTPSIKEVETMQEIVRNKRQMTSTAFQNFDQKTNQLYNLLSSVMKAFNEMRMGTVRNML